MAILQSCCFWRSLRKGTYASAIYTLAYFSFSSLILLISVNDEQDYLAGETDTPISESILEGGHVTPTTVIFNVLFLICSLLLVVSSVLVIVALQLDKRTLLLPWIVLMLGDVCIELAHLIYLAFTEHVIFEPAVGFIFTIDFFIMCLNCYCLLCVVSQYQNYRDGRGCRRMQLTTPQIILQVSQTEESGTSPCLKSSQLNQIVMSPFISSKQATNVTTIPADMDTTRLKLSPVEEIDHSCSSWNETKMDSKDRKLDGMGFYNVTVDMDNHLRVPIILKSTNTNV